jgi:nucleotide-binding universal stress UspA family protein
MTQNSITLWAVDPFADKRTQLKVAGHLKAFLRGSQIQIEPTSVLNPGELRLPPSKEDIKTRFQLAAQKAVDKITQGLKVPNLMKPSMVYCDNYSQRKSVETFLDFAQERKAELIALGTHSRTGVERWLFGSFAETLVLLSQVPLLIVNPKTHLSKPIKIVFFPTDLSDASKKGIEKLTPTLKRLKAKVILYHKIDYVIPETYSMIYRSDLYEKYLKDDEVRRKKTLEDWALNLKKQGVTAQVVIDDKPGFIPKSIVQAAKKHKSNLIALVSQTGTASATILGSITRQVVRTADCPIWSWHIKG